MFNEIDLKQFTRKSVPVEKINFQINSLIKGFPFINLFKPATHGNGIIVLDNSEISRLENDFEKAASEKKLVKFVPASGAATRMFKHLFEYVETMETSGNTDKLSPKDLRMVQECLSRIRDFAFYEELRDLLNKNGVPESSFLNFQVELLKTLLGESGLNYGKLPKGLIKFHRYKDEPRTASAEHLYEGLGYAKGKDEMIFLHFTVSPEHLELFKSEISRVLTKLSLNSEPEIEVTYSVQKSSTDTIAVDLHNQPFREKDGSIHFRPGGHGALIENLNDIEADIIFIKNIDNVVPDHLKDTTVLYKKALAGYLLDIRQKVHGYLAELEAKDFDPSLLSDISDFYKNKINPYYGLPSNIHDKDQIKTYLMKLLNRPIRVCGMVKNQGEPGGGPFWVKESDGSISLQIVESSQVNLNDGGQKKIFESSTHFNPVDLVCSTKDYKGNKFNLEHFINPETGFISVKSKDGRELKALELPGLWNGAMAEWITLFVEVPLITFNPVKTINDLLRKEHQQ